MHFIPHLIDRLPCDFIACATYRWCIRFWNHMQKNNKNKHWPELTNIIWHSKGGTRLFANRHSVWVCLWSRLFALLVVRASWTYHITFGITTSFFFFRLKGLHIIIPAFENLPTVSTSRMPHKCRQGCLKAMTKSDIKISIYTAYAIIYCWYAIRCQEILGTTCSRSVTFWKSCFSQIMFEEQNN